MTLALSQAIRKGCELTPKQAINTMVIIGDDGKPESTCAIAAAAEALGILAEMVTIQKKATLSQGRLIRAKFLALGIDLSPMVTLPPDPNPHSTTRKASILAAVAVLNDYRGWSRERIAGWLESIGL